jgi:hypothetical protein
MQIPDHDVQMQDQYQ